MNQVTQPTKKWHHDTHGSRATLLCPSLAASWATFWNDPAGTCDYGSHRNGQWLGWREVFHMISFITGRGFLPNTLISGIFLAYLLNTFHGVWIVCLHPSPLPTVSILHWYHGLLRSLTWYNACFLFMLNIKPVRERQVHMISLTNKIETDT